MVSGGVNGNLLYLFTNLGLFAVVINLETKMGTANIVDYAGLVRRSPFLSIALLAFIGVTMVVTLLIALYGQPFIDFATDSTQILAAVF